MNVDSYEHLHKRIAELEEEVGRLGEALRLKYGDVEVYNKARIAELEALVSARNITKLIDRVAELEAERDAEKARADSVIREGLSNCCRWDGGEPCEPFKSQEIELVEMTAERDRLKAALKDADAAILKHKAAMSGYRTREPK